MVVFLVGERGFQKGRYCADDSMRRDSEASSMWRPGCQLFLAFVRSQSTQTRKSRACISRSHGPTTTPTSPTCAGVRTASNSKKKPPTSIIPGDDSYQGSEGASTLQNAEIVQFFTASFSSTASTGRIHRLSFVDGLT